MAKKTNLKAVEETKSAPPALQSTDDVEAAVTRCAMLDIDINRLESDFNEEKQKLFLKYSPLIDPLLEERKQLEAQVLKYAQDHRAEIKGKKWSGRFWEIAFSKFAERVELLLPIAQVVANLKKNKLGALVKVEESVDKKDLKSLDAKLREKVGFEVIPSGEKPKLTIDHQKFQINQLPQQKGAAAR